MTASEIDTLQPGEQVVYVGPDNGPLVRGTIGTVLWVTQGKYAAIEWPFVVPDGHSCDGGDDLPPCAPGHGLFHGPYWHTPKWAETSIDRVGGARAPGGKPRGAQGTQGTPRWKWRDNPVTTPPEFDRIVGWIQKAFTFEKADFPVMDPNTIYTHTNGNIEGEIYNAKGQQLTIYYNPGAANCMIEANKPKSEDVYDGPSDDAIAIIRAVRVWLRQTPAGGGPGPKPPQGTPRWKWRDNPRRNPTVIPATSLPPPLTHAELRTLNVGDEVVCLIPPSVLVVVGEVGRVTRATEPNRDMIDVGYKQDALSYGDFWAPHTKWCAGAIGLLRRAGPAGPATPQGTPRWRWRDNPRDNPTSLPPPLTQDELTRLQVGDEVVCLIGGYGTPKINRGDIGVVVKVHPKALDRTVIVKFLPNQYNWGFGDWWLPTAPEWAAAGIGRRVAVGPPRPQGTPRWRWRDNPRNRG